MNAILKTGGLAYWDTFAGPVPCRVTAIRSDRPDDTRPGSWQSVDIELTATKGAYKAGETHSGLWGLHVFPRAALRVHRYSSTIGAYRIECDKGQQ